MKAFRAIATAIVKGFVRDKMSMFFAVYERAPSVPETRQV